MQISCTEDPTKDEFLLTTPLWGPVNDLFLLMTPLGQSRAHRRLLELLHPTRKGWCLALPPPQNPFLRLQAVSPHSHPTDTPK